MGDRETAKGSHLDRGLEPSVFETPGSRGQRRRRGDLHICPECEWNGGGRYSQDVVDRLDEELDHGTEAVLDDLNILVRANMEDQIDRFVAALNGDNILPEDF